MTALHAVPLLNWQYSSDKLSSFFIRIAYHVRYSALGAEALKAAGNIKSWTELIISARFQITFIAWVYQL